MKLYAFSGLGADERVFDCLKLHCSLIGIPWIGHGKQESLEAYSERIAGTIETDERFGLIGVSFGGIVAVEVSKLLKPEFTILVSSAETVSDLPFICRVLEKTSVVRRIPSKMFVLPNLIAKKLFGTRNALLSEILSDTNPKGEAAMFKLYNSDCTKNQKNCRLAEGLVIVLRGKYRKNNVL